MNNDPSRQVPEFVPFSVGYHGFAPARTWVANHMAIAPKRESMGVLNLTSLIHPVVPSTNGQAFDPGRGERTSSPVDIVPELHSGR